MVLRVKLCSRVGLTRVSGEEKGKGRIDVRIVLMKKGNLWNQGCM